MASHHTLNTEYNWLIMGSIDPELKLPSSPVVFVYQEGVFQCSISDDEKAVTPHLMSIKLQAATPIGKLGSAIQIMCPKAMLMFNVCM